ncbi:MULTISPECIES: DUF997 family protein [Borreliella]|uniref:DUF997 domain-containing protein n=2 Tax=Borreliella TaxID=64895 RepID=A0ABM7D9W8_BORGP|nr:MULTISPECIES: DUF997 family protein [Borreliella]APQ14794.1 hypothetical protein BLA33_00155 [Borreliella garinii]AZA26362.1 DUF997 domain-containing protein [Borreliella bavariensis PBi]AZA28196.1 DUF997 domain-containing protein [Borreliella garinii]
MRNRILYAILLYICMFFLWCCCAYFINTSATIFNIPLWFFLSGILFPSINFFLVCFFILVISKT